jgi:hypothetical protein
MTNGSRGARRKVLGDIFPIVGVLIRLRLGKRGDFHDAGELSPNVVH